MTSGVNRGRPAAAGSASRPPRAGRLASSPPPARRTRRRLARLAATALVVAGLAGAAGLRHWAGERTRLARASEALVMGRMDEATAGFAELDASPWFGEAARAGSVLAADWRGRPAPSTGPDRERLRAFPLRALMDSALRSGNADAARRLAEHADGLDDAAPLYRVAALVATGAEADAEAREAWAALPPGLAPWGLAGRVREVLDHRAEGRSRLVRDRHGRLLGTLGDDGRLALDDPPLADLLPLPALDGLSAPAGAEGLRLSLDLDLSRLALEALEGVRGTIVLLDADSGEVLAAVSDARTRRRVPVPALEERREPASIMKLITTAAALRAGLDPDREIAGTVCTGSKRYGNGVLWCSYRAGRLSGLDEAMALSCNSAFADLGARVGRAGLLDEMRRWGFDRSDAAWAGRVVAPTGDARQLADLAIGLEATDITPLHAALLAAVIADGGEMPEPSFVAAGDGALGVTPRPVAHAARRPVLPAAFVATLREAMEEVALAGTAAGIAPSSFAVAMKTGTASQWRVGYHVNYIGVGPLPEPRIAFCVRVTYRPTSRSVSHAAREVTRRLLAGLAQRHAANRILLP